MGTMMQTTFADSAKVMSKGQVTIPKEVRKVLGVQSGDKVTFVVKGKNGSGNEFCLICDETASAGYE